MRQTYSVISKEIKIALRERLVVLFGIIIMTLLSVAMYAGYITYKQQKQTIDTVQKERRQEWLNQHEKHPHIAAHYGTYVFKPKTVLSVFDFGIDTYTGTSMYLEAHHQHEFMFRPAQLRSSMVRFGELSVAMVLKIFLPLLVIFITFSTYTKERENGTLKLLLSQGVSLRVLTSGKIIATSILVSITLIPLLIGLLIALFLGINNDIIPDMFLRILLLLALYLGYIFILIVFSVWVSLQCKNGKSALLILLVCWIFSTILLPKAAANLSESSYPLPSMQVLKNRIQDSKDNGLDGKLSKDMRYEALKDSCLQEYDVDSIHQLPFNFSGYSMQASEEYSDKVYDYHIKNLHNKFYQQNFISSLTSFLNPYQATHNISMALATSDIHTSIHFENKVNAYRRTLIKTMNNDMTYNSKYGEFFEYKVGKNLWEEVPKFKYETPSVLESLAHYKIEIITLFIWLILMLILLKYAHQKSRYKYV